MSSGLRLAASSQLQEQRRRHSDLDAATASRPISPQQHLPGAASPPPRARGRDARRADGLGRAAHARAGARRCRRHGDEMSALGGAAARHLPWRAPTGSLTVPWAADDGRAARQACRLLRRVRARHEAALDAHPRSPGISVSSAAIRPPAALRGRDDELPPPRQGAQTDARLSSCNGGGTWGSSLAREKRRCASGDAHRWRIEGKERKKTFMGCRELLGLRQQVVAESGAAFRDSMIAITSWDWASIQHRVGLLDDALRLWASGARPATA